MRIPDELHDREPRNPYEAVKYVAAVMSAEIRRHPVASSFGAVAGLAALAGIDAFVYGSGGGLVNPANTSGEVVKAGAGFDDLGGLIAFAAVNAVILPMMLFGGTYAGISIANKFWRNDIWRKDGKDELLRL